MAIKAIEEVIQQSRSDDAPDINGSIEAFQEWEAKGSDEWKAARKKRSELMDELNNKRSELIKQAAQRQFDELNDDLNNIYEDAKKQAEKTLVSLYDYHKDSQKGYSAFMSADVVSLGGGKWLLDADATKNRISGSLHLHIKALERDKKLLGQLTIFINDLIKNSDFVAAPGTKGTGELVELIERRDEIEPAEDNEAEADEIIERAPSKKKAAEYIGAITEMGERALSITDRKFQFALSTRKNKTAYLIRDKKLIESLEFNDGRLSLSSNGNSSVEVRRGDDLGEAEIDLQLLKSLFTAIYYNVESATEDTVTVYVPTLCKHLGVNITSGKAYPLFNKINAFNDCVGVFGNGNLYALLKFIKYDKEQNLMTFASPYMNKLISDIAKKNTKKLKSGDVKMLPAYSYLIHSNIANERNKVAVEIVHAINSLIFQRGFDSKKNPRCRVDPTDGAVITEAHISFNTILDYVPELQRRIEGSATNNAKNAQLKRAFSKAYELLRTKTDIYKNYIDLKIPNIIPTASTLNTSLNITHKGLDPNYKSKK